VRTLLTILALLVALPAYAQNPPVYQSGYATPGHVPVFVTNGVIKDGGSAANPNITSFGTVGQGPAICTTSAPITSGAYAQLCLGAFTSGQNQISSFQYGSAPASPLLFNSPAGVNFTSPIYLNGTLPVTGIQTLCESSTGALSFNCASGGGGGANPGGSVLSLQYQLNSTTFGGLGPTANSIFYYDPSGNPLLGTQGSLVTASSLVNATAPVFSSSGTVQQATINTFAATSPLGLTAAAGTTTIALSSGGSTGAVYYWSGSAWTPLAGNNSGTQCFGENASGAPSWTTCSGGTGSGTVNSGNGGNIAYYPTTTTAVSGNANLNISGGALTVGSLGGSIGSVVLSSLTSGSLTIIPPSGTLGSVTAIIPANTGTVAETNLAQSWTAIQTITNSDLKLLGSSTGATTFTSANAGATNYTATIPANTGTFAETNLAQTFSAAQIFSSALNFTGLNTGTQVSCIGLNSSNAVVLNSGSCAGGVTGPGSSTSGDLVSFNGAGGNILADSNLAGSSFAAASSYGYPYGGNCISNAPPCIPGQGVTGGVTTPVYPLLNGANLWFSASTNPFLFSSTSPIVIGYSPSTVTCSSCSGQTFRLQFASASFSTQTITYTANGGDTAATVATGVCNAVIANSTLANPTTGWPFICDATLGGGAFNLEYATGTALGISTPTVTSIGTGTITLHAREDVLDGAFFTIQRRVTGHSLVANDTPECFLTYYNSIITYENCTIALSSTNTMETFATYNVGTSQQMAVGNGIVLGASDGAYQLAPFGGTGTLTVGNASGGGGIYFGNPGNTAVDSFLRENTGNTIVWTLGGNNEFQINNHASSTLLIDYGVTNGSAWTIGGNLFFTNLPTSGGTRYVCITTSGQLTSQTSC
jgi:hypothetical protein